ncbi:sulfatase [Marinifilum sp.]|uniref:sulfatase family protein n=1 Tax=Marinifilum sp. TaxID=2033137 RepID=UPI003BACB855
MQIGIEVCVIETYWKILREGFPQKKLNGKMFKIKKTALVLISAFILTACAESKVEKQRPNILWINSDDLGVELACYGNQDVNTPNIDQLASEGVLYKNCYAPSPACSPSRSSMITGMYPTAINCLEHRTVDKRELPNPIQPITDYFREAGYFCTNGSSKNMSKFGKGDFNFKGKDIFDGTDWKNRKPDQPFFAQIQIFTPHRPFHHDKENPIDPSTITLPQSYPDHPLLKADWAMYLESIQLTDKKVGEIMKRLEDEGVADNTIVVFFGDNGRPHLRDKQFLYEGGLKVPLIIRWPEKLESGKKDDQLVSLIDVTATCMDAAGIKVPEYMHGQVFLGEKAKKREYVFGFRQRAGDAIDDIRSITDGRYKLIWNRMPEIPWMQMSGYKKSEYPAYALFYQLQKEGKLNYPVSNFMADKKPEIELFDLRNDPMEFKNLAKDAKYADVKNRLFNTIKENLKVFEKGMIPETPETTAKAVASSKKYFKSKMKKMGLNHDSSNEEIIEYWNKKLLNE